MFTIYSIFRYIFGCIGSVFTWIANITDNCGMPFSVLIGFICCMLALDFFVTFIRLQSVGAMMSDSSASITAREGSILGVKGFHVKK